MPYKRRRKRNPEQFTIDEIRTAQNIVDEGYFLCQRTRKYVYPAIRVRMCVKEALEPTARTFGTGIIPETSKKVRCPPELFPPDGKGAWSVQVRGRHAEAIFDKLRPLIPKYYQEKWEQTRKTCIPHELIKPYRPRKYPKRQINKGDRFLTDSKLGERRLVRSNPC